jgi:pimeloyl-ACP methyl ester carboxylesterase
MRLAQFLFILAILFASPLAAQPPQKPAPMTPEEKRFGTQVVLAAASVPYMVDMVWQIPLGSRVSWVTSSARNPNPRQARANVFLLRGTGTMFSPGFGDLCTKLRRSGIWAEDLGSVGESWIVKYLIDERKAGRLNGPIILVGHSRGGRHILDAAHELQKAGMKVDMLICLDVAAPITVPGNVIWAMNLYMTQHRIYPAEKLKATPGSLTHVDNFDLNAPSSPVTISGLNHFNITADPGVQDFVMKAIVQAVSQKSQP